MNTMPRARTCVPSGTCVAVTRAPAANAGSRIDTSTEIAVMGRSQWYRRSSNRLQQSRQRVIEKAEEVLRFGIAADGKRQHHGRDLGALGDPLRCAIALVRRAEHHLYRLSLDCG